ncbi:MAG: hypothetical protein ACRD0H_18805, partial [Actinomycetes bacterium]
MLGRRRYGQAIPGHERVYQYHIRKSAGTSLVYAFFALAGEDPPEVERRLPARHFTTSGSSVFVEHDKRLSNRGNYFFGSSHIPAWDLDVPEGSFTVTVLRDPVDRVRSLWKYLRDPGSDTGYAFPAPPEQRRWAADGFEAFLERVPAFHLLNQIHMFSRRGSVDEAAAQIRALSCVLRTDRFADDLSRLGQALRLPLTARSERKTTPIEPLDDRHLTQL